MPMLNALYFPPLDGTSAGEVAALQHNYRLAHLDLLLRRASQPETAAALGARHDELLRLVGELLSLSDAEPGRFAALVDGWAAVFLLSRLLQEGLTDDAKAAAILASLQTVIDTGALPGGRAVDGWRLPVYDDAAPMGLGEGAARPAADGWQALALDDSLHQAHDTLTDLWPEAVQWARVMVPAFVDLGGRVERATHRSASYGADSPICVTRVGDGFQHAEDLVHELQHLRLHLFTGGAHFGCWKDHTRGYASPYRSDPRPLRGLLIGLHAFLTVNELGLRAMERQTPTSERLYGAAKMHAMNLFSYRALAAFDTAHGDGAQLMAEMAAALVQQDALLDRHLDAEMRVSVAAWLDDHVGRVAEQGVELMNGGAEYRDPVATVALAAEAAGEVQLAS